MSKMAPHALESYWLVEAYVALVGSVAPFLQMEASRPNWRSFCPNISLTIKGKYKENKLDYQRLV
jgi:hypothetical protein